MSTPFSEMARTTASYFARTVLQHAPTSPSPVTSLNPEQTTAQYIVQNFSDYFKFTFPQLQTSSFFDSFGETLVNIVNQTFIVLSSLRAMGISSFKALNQLLSIYSEKLEIIAKPRDNPMCANDLYACAVKITSLLESPESISAAASEPYSSSSTSSFIKFWSSIFPTITKTKICYVPQQESLSVLDTMVNWVARTVGHNDVFEEVDSFDFKCFSYSMPIKGPTVDSIYYLAMIFMLGFSFFCLIYFSRLMKLLMLQNQVQNAEDLLAQQRHQQEMEEVFEGALEEQQQERDGGEIEPEQQEQGTARRA